eukprot:TRINITY_DN13442_c0_g1_i1.p1 TRINITY_DN13442_c0_g1~~TRINITY_DN13442_c0_g1_i1.p1  ORF type:complete len:145 (-),score=32.30 TRINITY_DN13442_c0_g1_i1:61-432(-)
MADACEDEQNPIVCFYVNHAEIQRRQGQEIMGAPALGAPTRTWASLVPIITAQARKVIDGNKFIFDFENPLKYEMARHAVNVAVDVHGIQWAQTRVGFPPIAEVVIILPKNTVNVQHLLTSFP